MNDSDKCFTDWKSSLISISYSKEILFPNVEILKLQSEILFLKKDIVSKLDRLQELEEKLKNI